MTRTLDRYPQTTASTQADTEAPASSGASVSFVAAIPATGASCAAACYAGLDWVPARELLAVPAAQRTACAGCPLREACLQWAVTQREAGYWAGSTSHDRLQMATTGRVSVVEADRLQAAARRDDEALRIHADQPPSMHWYRQGCRCDGCRAENAATKQRYRRSVA